MKKIILGLILIILVAAGTIFLAAKRTAPNRVSNPLDDFARCLSEKGVVMYGTNVCPHCQEQKNIFGSSFTFIHYIDCYENIAVCQASNIEKIPAWDFSDGTRLLGVQPLESLSRKSGCPYEQ